jgi:hypothetical protein
MRHDRGGWDIEFYADEQGREPCREWADGLSPIRKAAFTAGVEVVLAKLGQRGRYRRYRVWQGTRRRALRAENPSDGSPNTPTGSRSPS